MTGHPNSPTAPFPPLRLLFWESTVRCNLACAHCRRIETADEAAREDLTTAEFRRVLDSTASLGKPIIVFSGGEPLMRDDWETLAAHARSLGLPTALATNGTLVDGPLAKRIAAAGFRRVSISLDGADAATHDAFRRVQGSFERALAGIAHLRAVGMPMQVNATIAAHNVDQLDDIYALVQKIDVEALHLFLLVPVGCGMEIGKSHQLAAERYEKVLQWVLDRQADGQIELKATCAPHYYRLAAQRAQAAGGAGPAMPGHHGRGCMCGVSVAFVSHKGEVFPCGYLPVQCGSVREKPFAEIWRSSAVFAKLRDYEALLGKCGRCEFKGLCGGCRARAFALTGNYLAAEPACTHCPGGKG
jgi:radical SAM protein with 4Fe4S-binding SPASM domain